MFAATVDARWLELIKQGIKQIEGRLRKANWATLQPGHEVVLSSSSSSVSNSQPEPAGADHVQVRVLAIRRYATFAEMLANEDLNKLLPGIQSPEEGLKIYKHYYPSDEAEKEHGVVAVEVERVLAC